MCHLFFDFDFAWSCWQLVGTTNDMMAVEYVSDWLLDKLETEPGDNLVKIATVLWAIWFARNQKIFEGKQLTPDSVMQWSSKQISEWQVAQKKRRCNTLRHSSELNNVEMRWCPPAAGELKVNVDASVHTGQYHFSVGMVVRDHMGQYVRGKTMRFEHGASVLEAELVGIVEALKWIEEASLTMPITLESDSLLSINAIKKNSSNLLEMGDLIEYCSDFLGRRKEVKIGYVRKQANMVAHLLAKTPCEPNGFVEILSPPMFLLETLMYDYSD